MSTISNILAWVRGFADGLAPRRNRTAVAWRACDARLDRLADAEDGAAIEREIERLQPSDADMDRLRRGNTPIRQWRGGADGLVHPDAIIGEFAAGSSVL